MTRFLATANAGNLRTEETREEEETPAVEAPRAKKSKTGGSPELPTDLAEKMRTELIRRASEVTKVAETSRNLKGTHVKMLREAARSITAGARMDPAPGAFAIMEGRIATLEVENRSFRKELASRFTAEKSSETTRLAVIERKMEELGPSLIQLIEERLQNIERRRKRRKISKRDRTRRDHEKCGAWSSKHSSDQGRTSGCHGMGDRRKKKQEEK